MLLDQFRDFMILILLAASVIAGVVGEFVDAIAIVVIVLLNAFIGFIQEFRAQRAMDALKGMAAPLAKVIRSKKVLTIKSDELVKGDIVLLEQGMIVPADLRLFEVSALKVDEALLTGESVPVEKITEVINTPDLLPGDRKNMAYKGTLVTYGRGLGVVTETGMETEIGKIAGMIQREEEVKTPLQRRLERLGKRLAVIVLFIALVVFVAGVLRGEEIMLMFLTAISLAVAAIPEALPAVITISLALGARRLVRQKALIRRLPAVETLGSVTYICTDKTGTLTENRMRVEEVWVGGRHFLVDELKGAERPSVELLLKGFSLNNDVQLGQEGNLVGDPTEIALLSFSEKMGFEKADTEKQHPRVMELPFDSERKMMTTLHKEGNQYIAFTKGGVDQIIERSTAMLTDDGIREIDPERILSANAEIARKGQRVLGLAMKRLTALPEKPEELENELIFVGLAGMIDPPRKEAYDAVRLCKKAGIRPVMITGDHPLTAEVIAKRLGIIESEQDIVTTGRQLREIPEEELKEKVEHIRVYARVAPEQKLRIVKALQGRGEFVAMTGDGVNDAPALKRADIGIAMGITGTDVSREAAHMVLLDDNFATIVKAIREGRKIYDNIRKFIRYLLTTNSGEVWTLFLAPFLGLPVPLLPIHILWINLMTDSLPALALSLEPEEKGIMERPPRRPGEGIFSRGLGFDALWVGLFMAGLVLFTEVWSIGKGHEHWQTMVFTVMCLTQLGNVLAIRSEEESFFRLGVFSNPALLGAVVVSFILQMAVVYIPYLNPIFKTAPLTAGEIGFCVFLSSLVFVAVELKKLLSRLMKRKATR